MQAPSTSTPVTGSAPTPAQPGAAVTLATAAVGLFMVVAGTYALLWPRSFAETVEFPVHIHFLHDVGAFQIGLGVALLLALIWADSLAAALGGALVTNVIHTTNHVVDLDLGGRVVDAWLVGTLMALTLVALVLRWRQLGGVLGRIEGQPASPALAPFVRQKTVAVTTYRRNGTPVATPVSIAVDGRHAVFRSYEKAWKTRRLRRNPRVEVAPSTGRGRPTGVAVTGQARRLEGQEARHASRLLARKHPLLHGVVVPLGHFLGRRWSGHTVHFEMDPDAEQPDSPPGAA